MSVPQLKQRVNQLLSEADLNTFSEKMLREKLASGVLLLTYARVHT